MEHVKIPTRITGQKILANVSEEYARSFGLPDNHRCVGFYMCSNDDVAYLSADDATKKARIKVIHAQTYFGGNCYAEASRTGTGYIMFSAEKIQDIKSAMSYIQDFVANQSALYRLDGDTGLAYYAQTIARTGSFFEEWCHVPKGMAYSYLVGAPVETGYALDQAMKAGSTKLGRFWPAPTHANSLGALLYGTESACKAATAAFIEAVDVCSKKPMELL